MRIRTGSHLRLFSAALLLLLLLACFSQVVIFVQAQTETTGAFRGRVVDESGAPLPDATVRAINKQTGVPTATRTTADGYFTIGLLQPGDYTLTVLKGDTFDVRTRDQRLTAVDATTVLPEPFVLRKRTATIAAQPTPVPTGTQEPTTQATPVATAQASPTPENVGEDIAIDINKRNPRRGGVFTREEVSTLPLGATTLTRTFDELALLLPGVAPPPQTLGNIAGPGVGPGVGSAGQFAVNGLRSRSNNFTVDGSDNNDEDIGVRRQGFFALVPQPIESIQEYQVTTLLAPAQYGRNIGAQVNAVSKSGGNQYHGTIYGFINSSQLNARDTFDRIGPNTRIPLQGRALNADRRTLGSPRDVFINCATFNPLTCPASTRVFVSDNSGAENSFTLGQGGLVFGGPLIRSDVDNYGVPRKAGDNSSLFFFISAEGMVLNANQESNFAVPTVEERGIFRTGSTGIFFDPLFPTSGFNPSLFPSSIEGSAILSLFPFPNNPGGIYGRNTYTAVLPADAEGKIFSGKINANFDAFNRPQEFVARYNFTDDWRDIPVTGGALFSTLRPRVRTQNISTFLNTPLSGPNSSRPIYNQLRASYGRTRLVFDEVRDTTHLIPSDFARTLQPSQQAFLLNAQTLINATLPGDQATFLFTGGTVERALNQFGSGRLAPIGQVNVSGYSPIGVDVFNFPQRRVNNTYQLADTLTTQFGNHNLVFGVDVRRTELNSDLPRNARPLLTFNANPNIGGLLGLPPGSFIPERPFFTGADFAAGGAPSGVFQALTAGNDSTLNLRYYQLNFFGQDEWRIRPNLYLSFGLRYEYNTVPKSANDKIERTFSLPIPAEIAGLGQFIDRRQGIFDADKNNFAPRLGIAYSPELFENRTTVFRAGAGIFFDQILGAVISQSRNVFPNVLNTNFAGFDPTLLGNITIFPPSLAFFRCAGQTQFIPAIQPGTLNTLNPAVPVSCLTSIQQNFFGAGFPVTIPERSLKTPTAYQYAFTFEQQLNRSMLFSAAYVGTQGRHLLRQKTPNLGPNGIVFVNDIFFDLNSPFFFGGEPAIFGSVFSPISSLNNLDRPAPTIGGVTIFAADGNSRYDALQLQLRGRFGFIGSSNQFQAAYTFSRVEDDASDVFDLAGAPALPQNSFTFAGERAPANFDARHRISWNYITDLSDWGRNSSLGRFLFKGTQIAGDGYFQTGQPFTVNTIFDINLDGNLTDRPNTAAGIQQTGDRSRPLRLTVDPLTLLAPVGRDGAVPRNAFRAGNLWLTNVALVKNFMFGADDVKRLTFRMEIFNVFNRANYGIPVRFLEFPGFGQATDTVTPGRRVQFAVKYSF